MILGENQWQKLFKWFVLFFGFFGPRRWLTLLIQLNKICSHTTPSHAQSQSAGRRQPYFIRRNFCDETEQYASPSCPLMVHFVSFHSISNAWLASSCNIVNIGFTETWYNYDGAILAATKGLSWQIAMCRKLWLNINGCDTHQRSNFCSYIFMFVNK